MTAYHSTLPDQFLFEEKRDDFWVFAYGSLMWRPDFEFLEKRRARLQGYSRSLCIYSWVHRGTREVPGLVFGLDNGGFCDGFAYKLAPEHQRPAVDMLRARELVTNVYKESHAAVALLEGDTRTVDALLYVVDHDHDQYAGSLPVEELERLVRQGKGGAGENVDYVLSTYDHLQAEGIDDEQLEALCGRLRN